ITLTGTGFSGAVQVSFGGATTDLFTVVSDSVIEVRVPPIAFDGPITVTTPGGVATSSASFTVTASPAPVVSFSTAQAPGNTQLTISGTGLAGTSKVLFNDIPAQFSVISDSVITAV